jgi:chorismate--pyruvate lyase
MVREVVLLLDEVPVVFARSVFPVASVTGSLNHLRHLRNSSLGAILFSHPGMQRSPFEIARLEGSCDYLPGQLQQSAAAWCRRSRFRVMGKSLMVSEVFLERFQPWPSRLPVQRNQRGRVVTGLHHRARSMRTD